MTLNLALDVGYLNTQSAARKSMLTVDTSLFAFVLVAEKSAQGI